MSRYHQSLKTFKQLLKEYTKTFEASQTEEETQSLQKEFDDLRRLFEKLLNQDQYDFSMIPSSDNE
jgi:hypothetical protein